MHLVKYSEFILCNLHSTVNELEVLALLFLWYWFKEFKIQLCESLMTLFFKELLRDVKRVVILPTSLLWLFISSVLCLICSLSIFSLYSWSCLSWWIWWETSLFSSSFNSATSRSILSLLLVWTMSKCNRDHCSTVLPTKDETLWRRYKIFALSVSLNSWFPATVNLLLYLTNIK